MIEEYCLGLLSPEEAREVERMAGLFPEVQAEIDRTSLALQQYGANVVQPRPQLKHRILDQLSRLDGARAFDLAHLPLINAYSDHGQWLRTVESIRPTRDFRNIYSHTLREDPEVVQYLVWARFEIKPEDHHDEHESFLILEGECECTVGGKILRLSAGDYLAIPLDVEHNVRVLSATPVKAIIQRRKAA
ncbi:cupin domain-containing protein [Larkinella soli]|uniref:cupin domain-containing protein n=1 Tax=Larkinella soli TaxID=1770527 RepID=UPI0013E3982B|nr:cupin domain-containing protein [Larkinella soli]